MNKFVASFFDHINLHRFEATSFLNILLHKIIKRLLNKKNKFCWVTNTLWCPSRLQAWAFSVHYTFNYTRWTSGLIWPAIHFWYACISTTLRQARPKFGDFSFILNNYIHYNLWIKKIIFQIYFTINLRSSAGLQSRLPDVYKIKISILCIMLFALYIVKHFRPKSLCYYNGFGIVVKSIFNSALIYISEL